MFIQPLVSSLLSFFKDTARAFVISDYLQLTHDKTYRLFLLDVCSLYTSVPHADGLGQ